MFVCSAEMSKDQSSSMMSTLTSKLLTDPNVLAAFSNELGSLVGKSSGYIERFVAQMSGVCLAENSVDLPHETI